MKIIFCFAAGLSCMIAITDVVYGQFAMRNGESRHQAIYPGIRDKDADQPATVITKRNLVKIKAVRHLSSNFPNLAEKRWYSVKNGLIARFVINSIQHIVAYDQNGNWRYSLLHYDETRLPKAIRQLLRKSYYNYTVRQAQEIHFPHDIIYQVEMDDDCCWRIVRVKGDEILEVKKLIKTKEP